MYVLRNCLFWDTMHCNLYFSIKCWQLGCCILNFIYFIFLELLEISPLAILVIGYIPYEASRKTNSPLFLFCTISTWLRTSSAMTWVVCSSSSNSNNKKNNNYYYYYYTNENNSSSSSSSISDTNTRNNNNNKSLNNGNERGRKKNSNGIQLVVQNHHLNSSNLIPYCLIICFPYCTPCSSSLYLIFSILHSSFLIVLSTLYFRKKEERRQKKRKTNKHQYAIFISVQFLPHWKK